MGSTNIWKVQAPNGTIYRTNQLRRFMFSHPEWFAKPDTQYVSAYNFVLKKGQKLCMFANGWIVLFNDACPDILPSIHWWQAKSPDAKEHFILQEKYQHFLKTCGYFDLGDEPYWMFRDGFKKARESGVPVNLKNGWIIVRPVSLDEFPVVDIVCDISKPEYIPDENGNSHPKRLNDVHSHPKRSQLQWTLADPDGNIYRVENLFAFLRERPEIFPNARSANAMFSQIIAIRCGFGKGKKLTLENGWTALDRSDVHDLIEKNKPRLAEQMARQAREKKRTYYAVWYSNEHDCFAYTPEEQRNLALAHVVAFKSEKKRAEWLNEKVAACRVPCSAYQARYYVYWHQEKIEVIG